MALADKHRDLRLGANLSFTTPAMGNEPWRRFIEQLSRVLDEQDLRLRQDIDAELQQMARIKKDV